MQRRSHINVTANPVILPGTPVSVYTDATLTTLATLYDDNLAPIANPVLVDALGEFYYRAKDGRYWEQIDAEAPAEIDFLDPSDIVTLKFDRDTLLAERPPIEQGELRWNSDDFTLDLGLNAVTLQIGQEQVLRMANNSGTTIGNSFAASIPTTNSSSGQRPRVTATDILTGTSCRCFIGISSEDILHGDQGFITRFGLVRDIDTSGALANPVEVWAEGDRLWVAPGGSLTNVEPVVGNKILIGMVITRNANVGIILSNPHVFELSSAFYMAGIRHRSESTCSFVDDTRTFTIAPTGAHFWAYLGKEPNAYTQQSVIVPDIVGLHFLYFDSDGILKSSTSPWDLTGDVAPVHTVYWDGAQGWLGEERHAPRNQHARLLHSMFHSSVGARYGSGLSGVFGNSTLSVAAGNIYDEDISNELTATATTCRLIYRNPSSQMVCNPSSATPYAVSGGALQYDLNGTLTPVGVNQHVVNWVYMTNDPQQPIYVQVGQDTYGNVASAKSSKQILPSNITTREWKLLYSVIYKNAGGSPTYVEQTDYRDSSSLPGGVVSTLAATSVITSDTHENVQASLDAKQSKQSGHEITYSRAGDIAIATGTLGRIIKRAGTITVANARLGTAGVTGDTTLVVKNGAITVGSITLASGESTGTLTLTNPAIAADDVLTVDCTAASTTKAKDLSITFLLDLA